MKAFLQAPILLLRLAAASSCSLKDICPFCGARFSGGGFLSVSTLAPRFTFCSVLWRSFCGQFFVFESRSPW
jgi:hypothetical protein